MKITIIDLTIITVYLLGIMIIGIYSSRKSRHSSDGYFLAGRGLGWLVIGASLFASNISTIHLVGLAASGYNEGLVWGNFEWMASISLIMLGVIFAPFYFRTKISTLPEFMEKRYGRESRTFLAFISIMAALFVHIGMSLYAGAVVFENFFGINIYLSIIVISLITGIYTIFGGLKAVVVTETIQTVILLLGTIVLTGAVVIALKDSGINSWFELKEAAKPGQLSMIHTKESLSLLGKNGFDSGLTWYACLLGYPILGLWYWCSDQTIVQRVLGAKSEDSAQKGAIFAGFLKLLPVFLLVFPGVGAYILYKTEIGSNANLAYPVLINNLLPIGIKGVLAAALLAALMSTIAAALNSIASLTAFDIVKRARPQTKDKTLIRIGQLSALVVMVLSILWSTQGGKFSSIFEAINKVASALAPPVAVVLLFGVLSKKGTRKAAFITLLSGIIMGITCFCLDFAPISGEMYITRKIGIPFMMQAFFLFCICSVIYFTISAFTVKSDATTLESCTWSNPMQSLFKVRFTSFTDYRIWTLLLIIVLIILYYLFR
ncbi:MAG: sodium:solute symporter [Anaerovoracaceae bacterium]